MSKLIIVAALQREIKLLIPASYAFGTCGYELHRTTVIHRENTEIAFGGIGTMSARFATQCAIDLARGPVGLIVSAGLAGALTPDLRVGDIFKPALVIGDDLDSSIPTVDGKGVLVTSHSVAGEQSKRDLAARFSAQAVDMEAYAVADIARLHNIPFMSVKAISDELEFPMPPVNRFISKHGEFQMGRFVLHTALRPWTWGAVAQFGRNSARAIEALCAELERLIAEYSSTGQYNRVSR